MYAYNARSALRELVEPTCKRLAECSLETDDAGRVLLLAIAAQESGWWARNQLSQGPARGLWQFEKYGGVRGVLEHPFTAGMARTICADQFVRPTPDAVHDALVENDMLACAFARLLLFTDMAANPSDLEGAWAMYLRTWRPGRPRRERWPESYMRATEAVSQRKRETKMVFLQL